MMFFSPSVGGSSVGDSSPTVGGSSPTVGGSSPSVGSSSFSINDSSPSINGSSSANGARTRGININKDPKIINYIIIDFYFDLYYKNEYYKKMNILSYYVKDLKDSLKNKNYKQVNNKYKIAIYYKSIILYFYNKQFNTICIYNDNYTKQFPKYFPKYFHKQYIELILSNKIYKFNRVRLLMKNLIINSWIEYKWYKSKFYLIKTYFCYDQHFRSYKYEIKYINNKIYKRYKAKYYSFPNKYRKRVIFIENKYELEYYSKVLFALF